VWLDHLRLGFTNIATRVRYEAGSGQDLIRVPYFLPCRAAGLIGRPVRPAFSPLCRRAADREISPQVPKKKR
jgi:hypothetical protein